MGQAEILEFLESNPNNWYSAKDIKEAFEEKGHSPGQIHNIYKDLYKLAAFKIIEWKGLGVWDHKKVFRANKQ